jgi:hypothetical protein
MATNNTREVTVVFSEEAYRRMEDHARRRALGVPNLIVEAIALLEWFDERKDKGETILVKRGRKLERVVSVRPSNRMWEASNQLRAEVARQQGPE